MARPADIDALGKLNFVTNYFLAGCTPPLFLFCEFAKEPAKDLAMLFLLPDLTDIGQAIFDPKAGRRRKPGRHGRKKRRGVSIPDPSDLIGQRVRSVVNPYNALQFGPVNFAFRVWNRFELISFTAAIIEGLADTFFEGILGVLDSDPWMCTEFARLVKYDHDDELAGGAGPPVFPVRVKHIEVASGFGTSDYTCIAYEGAYIVHFTCTVWYGGFDGDIDMSIALGVVGGGGRVTSNVVRMSQGETVTLTVSKTYKAGETCEWGLGTRSGFVICKDRQIVAFSKKGIPWPL